MAAMAELLAGRRKKKRFGVDPNKNPWDAGAKAGGTVPDYSGLPNKPYAADKKPRRAR